MSYLSAKKVNAAKAANLDSFDTAFMVLTGNLRLVPAEHLFAEVMKLNKDAVLWGPQARLAAHIFKKGWAEHGKALTADLQAAFDLSGDISVKSSKVKAAFKKHKMVGPKTWKEVEKKIHGVLLLTIKKSRSHFEKSEKAALAKKAVGSQSDFDNYMADAMSDHLQVFSEVYPERILHPEVGRMVKLAEMNPELRSIDKSALADRIKAIDGMPAKYFANTSDVYVGRVWTFTGLQMAHDSQVTEYQVIAQRDRRTCRVCETLDGKHFNVKQARDRMLEHVTTLCPDGSAKAATPGYCEFFKKDMPKIPKEPLMRSASKLEGKSYQKKGDKWFLGGKAVGATATARIDKMAIPPAWRHVSIATNPKAKLQAVGMDRAGRWQYRYSAEHSAAAAQKKFDRVKLFSRDVPAIRKSITAGIAAGDERALLLRMEDKTAIRMGTAKDLKAKKKAYGLTTLQSEHVAIKGNKVVLDFVAKEGIPAHYEFTDNVLAGWLGDKKLKTVPGSPLFATTPNSLNKYLQKTAGGKKYTLKDFRTYYGTGIAQKELSKYAGKELTKAEKKAVIKSTTEKVSKFLGNTPIMAKKSYIDPTVFEIIGGLD